MPITFDTLFSPNPDREVVERIFGCSALYVSGASDKFRDLPSWLSTNRLLEFGNLSHPRIRLLSGDEEIPPGKYLHTSASGYPRLMVRELTRALRDGAILNIESIEQMDEAVAQLCFCLEDKIDIPVQADLFGVCRGLLTPHLSWNGAELIILQLDGRTEWKLYSCGVPLSAARQRRPQPSEEPLWAGILKQGDLLYVPRRWWFYDRLLSEPSLCLRIKFKIPTGLDIVQQIINDLDRCEGLHMNCPRFGTEEQIAFLRVVRSEVTDAATKAGLLLGFLREARRRAEPRVRFSLPLSACADSLPISTDLQIIPLVRFLRADTLMHTESEDSVEIIHNGRVFRFRPVVGAIFDRLRASAATVGAMVEHCAADAGPDQVLESLWELARHGLISFG